MITQMLFTLFCTVVFCLGLYATSQDGYLLDFIALPFKRAGEIVKQRLETIQSQNNLADFIKKHPELKEQNDKTMAGTICYTKDFDYYVAMFFEKLGSPIILCITCMGSIWGTVWFVITNDVFFHLPIQYLVINCFAAAFIQTFIWKIYVKYLL